MYAQRVMNGAVSIKGKPLGGGRRVRRLRSLALFDEGVLRASRSRKVCMTCHWFRHHARAERIPVLTCQLHRGQIPRAST